MVDNDLTHDGDFTGDWVVNTKPGGTNTVGGRDIRGSMKEIKGGGEGDIRRRGEHSGDATEVVRQTRRNDRERITGGDVQIINCIGCEYYLVDPKSVLVRAGMKNEVVIVSDDPSKIEIKKEAGLNNKISYENHNGDEIERNDPVNDPVSKNKTEVDNRPVLEERTSPIRMGSVSAGSFISGWGKVEGNWYLLVDKDNHPVMRGREYVYQRK